MAPAPLRKNEKPLVCFIRLYGVEKRRMRAITKGQRGAHNDVAMAGIRAEMRRLEAAVTSETPPELLAKLAALRDLRIDVAAKLDQLLEEAGHRPAPSPILTVIDGQCRS